MHSVASCEWEHGPVGASQVHLPVVIERRHARGRPPQWNRSRSYSSISEVVGGSRCCDRAVTVTRGSITPGNEGEAHQVVPLPTLNSTAAILRRCREATPATSPP